MDNAQLCNSFYAKRYQKRKKIQKHVTNNFLSGLNMLLNN